MIVAHELREKVVNAIRARLDQFKPVEIWRTVDVLDYLQSKLPDDEMAWLGRGNRLLDIAKHELAQYAHQGEPEKGPYGQTIRRWKWHARRDDLTPQQAPVKAERVHETLTRLERQWDAEIEHLHEHMHSVDEMLRELLRRTEIWK